jgi:hypothetical protein
MWQAQRETLPDEQGFKVKVLVEERPLTFTEALAGWRDDESFREFILAELTAIPLPAFFWEMPAINKATLNRSYEFVTVNSTYLATVTANPRPFATQLSHAPKQTSIVSFCNLGGDAVLVVPKPVTASTGYGHIAAFLRTAPIEQQHALLQTLAEVVLVEVGERPLWVSTSGLGVYWLHVRLDSRPKYYTYVPYREPV